MWKVTLADDDIQYNTTSDIQDKYINLLSFPSSRRGVMGFSYLLFPSYYI